MSAGTRGHCCTLLAIFLPLAAGGSIYWLWRPMRLPIFWPIEALGLEGMLVACRSAAHAFCHAPSWLVYSLPQALWAFSFVICIERIWGGVPGRIGVVRMGLAALPSLFEPLQALGVISGRGDLIDFTLGICATALALGAARLLSRHTPQFILRST